MYALQLFLWYYILLNFLSDANTLDDVRKLLTRNDTKNWFDTITLTNGSSPYCKLCCVNITARTIGKSCGSHTLCKYPGNSIGPSCKGYVNVLFTTEEQNAILDVHNTLRNKVAHGEESRGRPGPQPPASNMRAITWNDELANIAERWGAQCIFAHDKCRDTVSYPVGQNLARGNLATNNELSLVGDWYQQVIYFNSNEVDNFVMIDAGYHVAGQYSQIVWADTNQIGCARAVFQQSTDANISYKEHLICNYGPSGNIPNQPVYKIGKACTSCPEGTVCSIDYSGLCESSRRMSFSQKLSMRSSSTLDKYSILILFIHSFNVLLCLYIFK